MPGPKPSLGERTLMKKLAVLVGFLVAAASAQAAWKSVMPVFVYYYNDGSGMAGGSFGDTRALPDPNSYLGCQVNSYAGYRMAYCSAYNAVTGRSGSCWTTNPDLLATIGALDADGYVYFDWAADGSCSRATRGVSSYTTPSQP